MPDTERSATSRQRPAPRALVFWPLFAGIAAADFVTKRMAEGALEFGVPRRVAGEWVRLTLMYNTGAAMNLSLGSWSRVAFSVLAAGMLGMLFWMYRRTDDRDAAQAVPLALVAAGALGNLLDRIRSPRGVVDFIDVGIGDLRFWTFNLADMGVTIGAALLAILLWRRPDTDVAGAHVDKSGIHSHHVE